MRKNYNKLDITKEGVYTIFVRDSDGAVWEEANVLKYFLHLRYGKRNKFQSRRKYAEDLYQFFQWAILQEKTKDMYALLVEFREMLRGSGFFYAFGRTSRGDFMIPHKKCSSIKSQIITIENYYYFLADNHYKDNLIRSSKKDYKEVRRKSRFGFGSGFGLKMFPATAAVLLLKKRIIPIEKCSKSTGKEDTYFPFKYFMGSSVQQDNGKETPGLVDWVIKQGDKTNNPTIKHAKYRDALLILLMGGSSARIGQACSLTLWDINERTREVYLIDPESDNTPHYLKTKMGRSERLMQKYSIIPSEATKASGFKYPIPLSHAPLLWINDIVKYKFFYIYSLYKTMINFTEMPWVFQAIDRKGKKSRFTPSPNGHANKMITSLIKDYREQFKSSYRNDPDNLELRQLFLAEGPHSFRHMYAVTLLTYAVVSKEHNSTLLQFFIMEGMGLKSQSVAFGSYLKIANSHQHEIVASFNKISDTASDNFINYIKLTCSKHKGFAR